MAPGSSKGKNSKQNVQRLDWKEASLNGSVLILSVVKEAATFAPFAELKHAASVALFILQTIQVWTRKNHGTYYSTCGSRADFTISRQSSKIKRHTNDLVTIQSGLSLLFGARIERPKLQMIGYLRRCERFLKT